MLKSIQAHVAEKTGVWGERLSEQQSRSVSRIQEHRPIVTGQTEDRCWAVRVSFTPAVFGYFLLSKSNKILIEKEKSPDREIFLESNH